MEDLESILAGAIARGDGGPKSGAASGFPQLQSESSSPTQASAATPPPSLVAASAEPSHSAGPTEIGRGAKPSGVYTEASSGGARYQREVVGESDAHPGYVRRRRCIEGPNERKPVIGRVSPLEEALRNFKERKGNCIIQPEEGMVFDSFDEAFAFYNLYSWEKGFGLRCTGSAKNNSKYELMKEIACMCQGKPEDSTKHSVRCGCKARIVLRRTDDHGWYIRSFEPVHNHRLSESCGEKRHWPSHKFLDNHTRDIVRHLRDNNVNLGKVYSIMTSIFGSVQQTPFTKRKLKTVCSEIARQRSTDDIQKTVQLFMKLRDEDPDFVYKVDFDDDGTIRTLMWTNGRGKMQYAHFGDVVTFDTTYKTNLYGMPFGMFVGVNNHFQSVLFAGVLMRSETIASFRWVFKEFVSLMGGKAPITVLTDQAAAMKSALESEWVGTRHRWCKWHVLRMAKEHLQQFYTKDSDFKDRFHKLINSMLSVEEFEDGWELLMEEYGLEEHPFIKRIYHERFMWAKAYFKEVFCAGQTSTQRSESANHMLKNQIPPGSPMHLFVTQYMKLLAQREEEDFEERRMKLGNKRPIFNNNFERHALQVYSPKMMEVVGRHIYEVGYYRVEVVAPRRRYEVIHMKESVRERWCRVRFDVVIDQDGEKYTCDCGQTEHIGLLCCHIIKVMMHLDVATIPKAHLMKRWTVDARDVLPPHLAHSHKDSPALKSQTFRHSSALIGALELVQLGDCNAARYTEFVKIVSEGKQRLTAIDGTKDGLTLEEAAASFRAESCGGGTQTCKGSANVGTNSASSTLRPIAVVEDGDECTSSNFCALSQLSAPPRKLGRGLPSSKRDKPGYEMTKTEKTRAVVASQGNRGPVGGIPPLSGGVCKTKKPPTCKGCNVSGHTKAGCVKKDLVAAATRLRESM